MRVWTFLLVGSCAGAQTVDYIKDVQPIFSENCTVCHKGGSAPAGLRLDSAAGLFSSHVIVPGNARESVLAQRLSDTSGNQMPPSGPLRKEQIDLIAKWIDEGAKADVPAAELARPLRVKRLQPAIARVTDAAQERAMLDYYCVTCHTGNDAPMGLKLDELDAAHVEQTPAKWELVVRKLRAGMMPPANNPRPSAAAYESMITFLENDLDLHRVTRIPAPGVHRLNRTEFANAIRDLLAVDIDPAKFLPSDDSTRGFDNIAGALSLSPALIEGYASAAEKISRLALGDTNQATSKVCRVPPDNSQDYHIDGMPFATRGGIICDYEFPADGDYSFKLYPINQGLMDNNRAFGEMRGEKLELLVDGALVKVYDWDKELATGPAVHGGTKEIHFAGKAGAHRVVATFLARQLAPGNDLDEHFIRSTIETGGASRIQVLPARRQAGDPRPIPADGGDGFSQPAQGFRVPSHERRRRDRMRAADCSHVGAACVPPSGSGCGNRPADEVLSAGPRGREFRYGHRAGSGARTGRSAVCVSQGSRARQRDARAGVPHQRSGTGFAVVVLLVEQHSGRPIDRSRGPEQAARAGHCGATGPPPAGRSAVRSTGS
jgi:mono/diheme cytochrome c family protein